MSEESAITFRKLVSAMRTTQKEYWNRRDKHILKKSIELEKRVDQTIASVNVSNVPDTDNGKFFLEVARLRDTTKQYFAEKKKQAPDKECVKDLFKAIKVGENKIDKSLGAWFDQQAIKEGKRIVWHVMERLPRGKEAHSIFDTIDEQLAKINLDDCYRHPACPGTMYFIAKEYIDPKNKK